MLRILGLDIGTTSIGFALIDLDKKRDIGSIVHMGVRIFPEARDPDGTPLNQTRRAKRMARRQIRRRRERRRSLNELLTAQGLLPKFGGPEWHAVMSADPYALRAKGLGEPLTPFELGRALYHLSKRRHFKERDPAEMDANETSANDLPEPETKTPEKAKKASKTESKDPPKETAAKDDEARAAEARKHLIAELKSSGKTLGQLLAARAPDQRRRGEHATRAVVHEEFDRLVTAQKPFHPVLEKSQFLGAVEEAIFAQRPVFWRKSTLGKCPLMPDEPLCAKSTWISRQRVMLEKLNNLALIGGNGRPLDEEERRAILNVLQTRKSMTWKMVRDALDPLFKARGETAKGIKFNLEIGDEKGGLPGNPVEAELARILGPAWTEHSHQHALRDRLPEMLRDTDYDEIANQRVVIRPERDRKNRRKILARMLADDYGITKAQADELANLHFPQGWEPYSTAALKHILPHLEKGVKFGALTVGPSYSDWRAEKFPDRKQPTGEILDLLPSPRGNKGATYDQKEEIIHQAAIRNPTVTRVRNELRKVVNNLIRQYGKPDLIRVELARDVGKSKREREEISKAMRDRQGQRKRAHADLVANNIAAPSDGDIEKWLLWKECGEQCPYTGDKIGFTDLFSGNPRFDIEHIWPISRSLDNSFRNKTLCRKDINIEKGDRTPFEYFRHQPEVWQTVKDRIWKMTGKGGMSRGKAKRFCAESMPDDFASRQLNDTGYAARQASEFLSRLWPDMGPTAEKRVQPVTGKVTAQLRRRWGLNHILGENGEKTRADHRHHAIDALVVACADGGYTQKLSRYFALDSDYRRGRGGKPDDATVPPPWATIRADAQQAVDKIIVSHRVRKKVSGPLHKETIYGDTRQNTVKNRITYREFVNRSPIHELTASDILGEKASRIRDDYIAALVRRHVESAGINLREKAGNAQKLNQRVQSVLANLPPLADRKNESGRKIRKIRMIVTRQAHLMVPASTGFADVDAKHHVAIYRLPDGKITSDVVSLFEAAKRLARREPVIRRDYADKRLVMSLAKGDALEFPKNSKFVGTWIVGMIADNGQIKIKQHWDAKDSTATSPRIATIIEAGGKKVAVDPIGRVRPAND